MKLLKALLLIIPVAVICACGSANADTKAHAKSEKKIMKNEIKMTESGFVKATIGAGTKGSDCQYIIKFENDDTSPSLDPINLDKEFMTEGAKIWVKFTRLRMQNRCPEANPVTIVGMEKREK